MVFLPLLSVGPVCPLVSVRKPTIEIIGFLSRRRLHLERSPSGTRHCSQPENADFLSEMFPDRHSVNAALGNVASWVRISSQSSIAVGVERHDSSCSISLS